MAAPTKRYISAVISKRAVATSFNAAVPSLILSLSFFKRFSINMTAPTNTVAITVAPMTVIAPKSSIAPAKRTMLPVIIKMPIEMFFIAALNPFRRSIFSSSSPSTNFVMKPEMFSPNAGVRIGFNNASVKAPNIPIPDIAFKKSVIGFKSG